MLRALTVSALLLALPGCGDDSSSGSGSGDPTKVTYDSELGVDLAAMERHPSGLYTLDQQVGTGDEAVSGSLAQVHYTGWLPDGTLFDTSRTSGRPFSFTLGRNSVIAGWEEGILGMHVGGKRRLVIPSDLGYGENGAPPVIPPNSVLVFDVELMGVR